MARAAFGGRSRYVAGVHGALVDRYRGLAARWRLRNGSSAFDTALRAAVAGDLVADGQSIAMALYAAQPRVAEGFARDLALYRVGTNDILTAHLTGPSKFRAL